MPAATTKSDLLDRTEREFAKLSDLLDRTPGPLRLAPDDEGVTPKDIVGHRAHWIELFLGWHADGLAGKDVAFPAPGYKWNQLAAYNADLRRTQADMGWDEMRDLLQRNHHRLTERIGSLGDAALYGGPMQGGRNHWTTGRWAEAAGASHYRSAARYLRARLRSAGY